MKLTGERELMRQLEHLQKPTATRRVMMGGLKESAKIGVKGVKQQIPSDDKGVRKAIKWRGLKVKESVEAGVKFGTVGKSRTSTKVRGDRPGVGIGARNIHWWFLGTFPRYTAEGYYRGVMPPQEDPITVLAMSYADAMLRGAIKGGWKQLKKEADKVRRS